MNLSEYIFELQERVETLEGQVDMLLKAAKRWGLPLVSLDVVLSPVTIGSAVYSPPNINVSWGVHPQKDLDGFLYNIRVLIDGVEHETGISVSRNNTTTLVQQTTFGFTEGDVVTVEVFPSYEGETETIQGARSTFNAITIPIKDAVLADFDLLLNTANTVFTLTFGDSANYPALKLRAKQLAANVYSAEVTDATSSSTVIQPDSTLGAVLDSTGGVFDSNQSYVLEVKLGDGAGNFSPNWLQLPAKFIPFEAQIGFTWTHQTAGLIDASEGSEVMASAPYLFGVYWEEDFANGTFFSIPQLVSNDETGTQLSARTAAALADNQEAILVVPTYSHSQWNASGLKDDPNSGIEAAHYSDMAAHAVKMITEFGFTKVIIGHEYKGFWNSALNRWDYEGYTTYYNTVYDAIKLAHPNVLIGGSYLAMQARGFGNDTSYNGVLIDSRDMDAHNYWLANANGFDAVVLDLTIDIHDAKAIMSYLRGLGRVNGKPHWHAEFYSLGGDTPAGQRQLAQELMDDAQAGDIILMWDEPAFAFDLSLITKGAKLAAPASLTPSYANDEITLNWTVVSGATDYTVEAKESGTPDYVQLAISADNVEVITAAEWLSGYGSALANGDYDFRIAARVNGVVQQYIYNDGFTIGTSSSTNPAQVTPFTKQLAGATPSKVSAPTTWNVGGVLEGSQDYWNHPSTYGAFSADGVAAIGGSAKTIMNVTTRAEIGSNLPGGNVQWSQAVEGRIWYLSGTSEFRKRENYGTDSLVFTAATAGYSTLHFNGEGSMTDTNDRYLGLVGAKGDGTAWMFVWDLVLGSKVDEIQIASSWNGASTFDAWGMGPNGTTIVLDGNPSGTTTNNWKCLAFTSSGFTAASFAAAPIAACPTRHFTLANLDGLDVLVTVDGYVMNGITGAQIRRINTLGPGVSTAQHVGWVKGTSCVIWTNGSKTASTKEVSLVWLDGSGFIYLFDCTGASVGWNGGEIYASGFWDADAAEFWLATTHAQTGDSRLHLFS